VGASAAAAVSATLSDTRADPHPVQGPAAPLHHTRVYHPSDSPAMLYSCMHARYDSPCAALHYLHATHCEYAPRRLYTLLYVVSHHMQRIVQFILDENEMHPGMLRRGRAKRGSFWGG
jgi:hypothetical protein